MEQEDPSQGDPSTDVLTPQQMSWLKMTTSTGYLPVLENVIPAPRYGNSTKF